MSLIWVEIVGPVWNFYHITSQNVKTFIEFESFLSTELMYVWKFYSNLLLQYFFLLKDTTTILDRDECPLFRLAKDLKFFAL